MTTKLTAKRFRTQPEKPQAPEDRGEDLLPLPDDGLGPGINPEPGPRLPDDQRITADEIAAVEAENLSSRQLRLARRIAAKNNIHASSDNAAVILLRRAGIDPFQRATLMDLVTANRTEAGDGPQNLPQRITPIQVPSTEQRARESHLHELRQIQREIAARRRRKLVLLGLRLATFVFLPTAIAGYYFYFVATPMYSAHSEFVIQQS